MSGVKNTVVILLLSLCYSFVVYPQDCNYRCFAFFGKTFIKTDKITLGNVSMKVTNNDTTVVSTQSFNSGDYDMPLFEAKQRKYEIHYSKDGFYNKFLEFDFDGADSSEIGRYAFQIELDITLIEKSVTNDYVWGLLEFSPITKANWDDKAKTIKWDFKYTNSLLGQYITIFERVQNYLIWKKELMETPPQ